MAQVPKGNVGESSNFQQMGAAMFSRSTFKNEPKGTWVTKGD